MTTTIELSTANELKHRAEQLKLHGLIAHWDELSEPQFAWLQTLIRWEESQRQQAGADPLRWAHAADQPTGDGSRAEDESRVDETVVLGAG